MDDQTVPAPFTRIQQTEQLAVELRYKKSLTDLRKFLAELDPPLSPQAIQGIASTDSLIREMRAQFGLLSSTQALELLGHDNSDARAEALRDELIVFEYGGTNVFPGFQFDQGRRSAREIVPELLALARDNGSDLGLACWMCSPSGYLDGTRPVDLLEEPLKVLQAARSHFQVVW